MTEPATVVHEWRVTGKPGQGFPSYDFTWRGDRAEWPDVDAEHRAREFVTQIGDKWVDGPHLYHRTVTYSPWEARNV